MIRVELPVLVFIYLIVFLAAIFSLWIVYEWLRRQSRERGLALPGSMHHLCLYFRRQNQRPAPTMPSLRQFEREI